MGTSPINHTPPTVASNSTVYSYIVFCFCFLHPVSLGQKVRARMENEHQPDDIETRPCRRCQRLDFGATCGHTFQLVYALTDEPLLESALADDHARLSRTGDDRNLRRRCDDAISCRNGHAGKQDNLFVAVAYNAQEYYSEYIFYLYSILYRL